MRSFLAFSFFGLTVLSCGRPQFPEVPRDPRPLPSAVKPEPYSFDLPGWSEPRDEIQEDIEGLPTLEELYAWQTARTETESRVERLREYLSQNPGQHEWLLHILESESAKEILEAAEEWWAKD